MNAEPPAVQSVFSALPAMERARSLPAKVLRRLALSGFEAVCEALYPDNDFGAPSWRDTDMVARAGALWDALPPLSRLTLEALYAGLELGGAALAPGVGPLSSISPARRLAIFNRLRRSRIWLLRLVGDAVKSSSTMVYLSHPAALRYLGVPEEKCVLPAGRQEGRRGPFADLVGKRHEPAAGTRDAAGGAS